MNAIFHRQRIPALALALAGMLAAPFALQAQGNGPHIGYVYPAGGKQGTSFKAVVGGAQLKDVFEAVWSGGGVEIEVLEHIKPMTQNQFNDARDKIRELQKVKSDFEKAKREMKEKKKAISSGPMVVWTPTNEALLQLLRRQVSTFMRRQPSPAIAENVIVQFTIEKNAPTGERELRLATPRGLTNPLLFHIGDFFEFSRNPVKSTGEPVYDRSAKFAYEKKAELSEVADDINIPSVLNGQMMPGTVDRFSFVARRGQELVAVAKARQLIPYLPDAVPGWFQAILTLYDAKGVELAYNDDFRFNPDPVLHFTVPESGTYVLEIKDSIYRGRDDFVYRISVGELPFINSVFPMGGQIGNLPEVEAFGWNLPVTRFKPTVESKDPGIREIVLKDRGRPSNPVPFAVDNLPEILAEENKVEPERLQSIALPVVVNGRIDWPGDWDKFRFEGRAGQRIVAEVTARRLNSPMDSVLRLVGPDGAQVAFNDDYIDFFQDKGNGLITHAADSMIEATLPVDGTYQIHIGEAQRMGGKDHAYRLRISAPRPGFDLRVVPSSVSIKPGSTAPVKVYARRTEGFEGEIGLALKNPPGGVRISSVKIPATTNLVELRLSMPRGVSGSAFNLELEGRAKVDGVEIRRLAVPAEDMMQAFLWRHLVAAKEWKVMATGRPKKKPPATGR